MAELLSLYHQNDLDHSSAIKVFNTLVEIGGFPGEVIYQILGVSFL